MAKKSAKSLAASSSKASSAPVRKRTRSAKSGSSRKKAAAASSKDTRFKPGQSGNPNGRPRKERSLLKHLETELDAEMQVTEGGKTMRLTKREALAKFIVNKALQGDPKMLNALLKQLPLPKPDEGEEHYSVRLDTVLRLLARKGQGNAASDQEDSAVDDDAGDDPDKDPDDGLEGGDQ